MPTWSIIHSRHWKAQIPYLARHFRVVTFDGRGNGKSDRPRGVAPSSTPSSLPTRWRSWTRQRRQRPSCAGSRAAAGWTTLLAADHPERVLAAVFIGPAVPLAPGHPERAIVAPLRGGARHRRGLGQVQPPLLAARLPRLSRVLLRADVPRAALDQADRGLHRLGARDRSRDAGRHGTRDGPVRARSIPRDRGAGQLPGAGHPRRPRPDPPARPGRRAGRGDGRAADHARGLRPRPARARPGQGQPAAAGLHRAAAPPRSWTRGRARRKRALFVSSPIGLGHARRDVAIAQELRRLHPDLEIDWLAQNPVTRVLEAEGERIHPASALLANESGHIESESAEHDLHCFQAWRRMDEILVANFMVFHDLVTEEPYDLWIGDEAWEVDYFLHENPELKRAAYVWLTDFVGWLPVGGRGAPDRRLQRRDDRAHRPLPARCATARCSSATPTTSSTSASARTCPRSATGPSAHFDFAGYVTGFDARAATASGCGPSSATRRMSRCASSRSAARASARALLRRVIAAFPLAAARCRTCG